MSCVSCEIVAVKSSISLDNKFTSSVFLSRVCLFVVISVSHQPLCSVSSVASWTNLLIKSLIIFLTLTKGSDATCSDTCDRRGLPVRRARSAKKSAIRLCNGLWSLLLRNCAKDSLPLWVCNIAGRCLPQEPLLATFAVNRSLPSSNGRVPGCLQGMCGLHRAPALLMTSRPQLRTASAVSQLSKLSSC